MLMFGVTAVWVSGSSVLSVFLFAALPNDMQVCQERTHQKQREYEKEMPEAVSQYADAG